MIVAGVAPRREIYLWRGLGGRVPKSTRKYGSWRKSSFSGANGCVEVLRTDSIVRVRDSKDREGPVLTFSHDAWRELLAAVHASDTPQ
jgi:uncharacterized protein DUF397